MKRLLLPFALALLLRSAFAATLHVPAEYPTIQAGINAAVDGDTVLLASGDYTGDGNCNISFLGKAIVVKSEEGLEYCSIDVQSDGRGFLFVSGEDSSSILEGISVGGCMCNGTGAGILIGPNDDINDGPIIKNCRISGNYASQYGGGLYADSSGFQLLNCLVYYNSARSGAALYCNYGGKIIIKDCNFQSNEATDAAGGIWMYHCNTEISGCYIKWCHGWGDGGAMKFDNCQAKVEYCRINNCSAGYNGGGACVTNSIARFQNCTFYEGYSGGPPIYGGSGIFFGNCREDTCFVVNCIFQAYFQDCITIINSLTSLAFNDFYGNDNNFSGRPPENIGILTQINANGDSCDAYYNIFLNPCMIDPEAENFQIAANSPCIDAGDPAKRFDPDSTVADIGALYFDQSAIVPTQQEDSPTGFVLLQTYPNPFNNEAFLKMTIPYAAAIELALYDITGRKIAEITSGRYLPGDYDFTIRGDNLSSGVYFCRLSLGKSAITRKVVFVK